MKIAKLPLFGPFLILAGSLLLVLTSHGMLIFARPYAMGIPGLLPDQSPVLVIKNVAVITMETEAILENQTVVIRDGMIDSIGESSHVRYPDDGLIIDGNGRYLVPGLMDMHVHILEENELLLFAANGVTSVRNMWGGMNFADHLGWRARIERGEMFGPTIYTSGPIMEGPPRTMPLMEVYDTPEKAAGSVLRQIEQGYDFIKVYDHLDLATYQAILSTAKENNIPVIGHVPREVGLEKVLESGQATIEHLSGFIDPDAGEYIIPEDELAEFGRRTMDAGVFLTPTIRLYQMHVPAEDLHTLEDRPVMRYVSPSMKFLWRYFSRPGAMSGITYQGDYPARIREIFIHTTRVLHEQGVKFVAGTDTDNPYLVPGFSLLDELDYLVEAGFSPYQALEAATRNAAEAMGHLGEFGTVTPGKRADLIVLEANPLEDIGNVRWQAGVVLHGRWLPKPQIQAMLEGLVASYELTILERFWPVSLVLVGVLLLVRNFWRGRDG